MRCVNHIALVYNRALMAQPSTTLVDSRTQLSRVLGGKKMVLPMARYGPYGA